LINTSKKIDFNSSKTNKETNRSSINPVYIQGTKLEDNYIGRCIVCNQIQIHEQHVSRTGEKKQKKKRRRNGSGYPLTDLVMAVPKLDKLEAIEAKKPPPLPLPLSLCLGSLGGAISLETLGNRCRATTREREN
jgi:hypothetical protein